MAYYTIKLPYGSHLLFNTNEHQHTARYKSSYFCTVKGSMVQK